MVRVTLANGHMDVPVMWQEFTTQIRGVFDGVACIFGRDTTVADNLFAVSAQSEFRFWNVAEKQPAEFQAALSFLPPPITEKQRYMENMQLLCDFLRTHPAMEPFRSHVPA